MISNKLFKLSSVLLLSVAVLSCQKMKRPALGDYPEDKTVTPTTALRFYTSFDSTSAEDKQINIRFKDSISNYPSFFPDASLGYTTGVHGTAYRGASSKALLYLNANDFAKSGSFTIAFWEKNNVPTGGSPQFLFSLVDKDYWHNSGVFALIDHNAAGSNTDSAVVKLAVEDHWFEFTGNNKMPGQLLNNQWHHLAFVYDETTSKMSWYVDGVALTGLPSNVVDWKDGANPHGKMKLTAASVSNFVLGGWNKHVKLAGPTDSWIESWKGSLDQFRLYNKALTATEVQSLFNSKM